jgi:hypothetical protein
MWIRIESSGGDARLLHATAARRLRFALRRLAWLVSCATVRMGGDGAPAAERRCRVELLTHAGETIAVSAIARDDATAVETALARASRLLARVWGRTFGGEGGGTQRSQSPSLSMLERPDAQRKRAVVGQPSRGATPRAARPREAHADA